MSLGNHDRVLVVAAHPDDEILGCGATMARWSSEGRKVGVLILGEGITSRTSKDSKSSKDELEQLHRQSKVAVEKVGAELLKIGTFPDNRFDTVALLDVAKEVEFCVENFKPNIILTHSAADLNVDHKVTCRAVVTACRPTPGSTVRKIYAFEVLSSTEWNFVPGEDRFNPNVFIDVSNEWERKIEAMRTYAGELRPFPHPRSIEALKASLQKWGSTAGVRYAEAFQLIRELM